MAPTNTPRGTAEVAGLALRTLIAAPNTHTTASLAEALGESESRVRRVLADLERAGWPIERPTGPRGALTVAWPGALVL